MVMTFPLENHRALGFLSNTNPDDLDPLEDQKATKPSVNSIGPSGHHWLASETPFRWRADNVLSPLIIKKLSGWTHRAKLSGFAQVFLTWRI